MPDWLTNIERDFMNNQNRILNKQTEFTKILMLATVVLAIGTFLTITLKILEFGWSDWSEIFSSDLTLILTIIFIIFYIMLFVLMVLITCFIGKMFFKNKLYYK